VPSPEPAQNGEQDGCQNSDDGDDDKQLDERKTLTSFHKHFSSSTF
jgi:hypothetical protein